MRRLVEVNGPEQVGGSKATTSFCGAGEPRAWLSALEYPDKRPVFVKVAAFCFTRRRICPKIPSEKTRVCWQRGVGSVRSGNHAL